MDNMPPPGKLRTWRKHLGLTIQKMAELCDTGIGSWKRWESGETNIPGTTAAYIALQIAWPGDICPSPPTPEEIKALRKLRGESQTQAAQSVDYCLNSWGAWEAGKPMPRIVWYIYRLGGVDAAKETAMWLHQEQELGNIRFDTLHKIRSSKNGN